MIEFSIGLGPAILLLGLVTVVATLIRATTRRYGDYDFSGLIYLFPFGIGATLIVVGGVVWVAT